MARPTKPPREYWDNERGEWCILYRGDKIRLGLAHGEVGKARIKVAEFVIAQANARPEETGRAAADVMCDEVLERYLARRTDEDPTVRVKEVARPEELRQRIRRLATAFGGRPVSYITEATCEKFTAMVGSDSYARRCLGDFQAALGEAHRAGLFREIVTVSMPPPPAPREDSLSVQEAVALVLTCWRHRDTQQRRVGGRFEMVDGRKVLVGGVLTTIEGAKRPWWHVGKFVIAAIATCSRSSRIFEASYSPEKGRPWMDVSKGVLHRQPPGARKTKKKAPTVDVAERLVAAMRRWSSDRVVAGRAVEGDRYVVQWQGQPADPKGAFAEVVAAAIAAARADDERRVASGLEPRRLFLRDDGTPKIIVRHTLRHTGVTWLSETEGVDVEDICSYAGMTRAMYDRVYGHAHKARSRNVVAAQGKKGGKRKKKGD